MGIGGFQRWLISTFPEIVRVQGNRFGEVYDHVAFDLNQILHQAARKASDRHMLAAAVFRELDGILKNCVPRRSIFFAFDGPGPVAKLVTQRKRRSRTRVEHVTAPRRRRGNSGRGYAVRAIDRLELTPGVETLHFLRDAIEYWAYTRLQNDRKYANVEVRISGPEVPGEGELKIIDFCRIGIASADESVVVIGGDADIVLQGLATTPIRDFFVYLRHFGNHGRKRVNYVLSVWELTRSLEQLFPGDSTGARLDFILLSIMNGNDYIPKARGVSLPRLWRRYVALKREHKAGVATFKGEFMIDAERRTFNWPFLYRLLERVGAPVTALTETHNPALQNGRSPAGILPEARISDEEIVYTGNEHGIPLAEFEFPTWADGSPTPSSDGSDETDEASDIVDEDEQHFETLLSLTDSCKLYDVERWLRMLLWTLHMYIDGHCADYTFQYALPYGPSCDIITDFITAHNGDPFTLTAPVTNAPALKPHAAAVAMLPKHAAHLLPASLQGLLDDAERVKKMFPSAHVVNVDVLVGEVDRVGLPERRGVPVLLRLGRGRGGGRGNGVVPVPGPKFEQVKRFPWVARQGFEVSRVPRCYRWDVARGTGNGYRHANGGGNGGVGDVMRAEYKKVGGARLTVTREGATR